MFFSGENSCQDRSYLAGILDPNGVKVVSPVFCWCLQSIDMGVVFQYDNRPAVFINDLHLSSSHLTDQVWSVREIVRGSELLVN